jgi:hypothetical protein
MPAWGKVLNEQQIANLTEFVFQSFILGKGVQDKGAGTPQKSGEVMSDKKKAS